MTTGSSRKWALLKANRVYMYMYKAIAVNVFGCLQLAENWQYSSRDDNKHTFALIKGCQVVGQIRFVAMIYLLHLRSAFDSEYCATPPIISLVK